MSGTWCACDAAARARGSDVPLDPQCRRRRQVRRLGGCTVQQVEVGGGRGQSSERIVRAAGPWTDSTWCVCAACHGVRWEGNPHLCRRCPHTFPRGHRRPVAHGGYGLQADGDAEVQPRGGCWHTHKRWLVRHHAPPISAHHPPPPPPPPPHMAVPQAHPAPLCAPAAGAGWHSVCCCRRGGAWRAADPLEAAAGVRSPWVPVSRRIATSIDAPCRRGFSPSCRRPLRPRYGSPHRTKPGARNHMCITTFVCGPAGAAKNARRRPECWTNWGVPRNRRRLTTQHPRCWTNLSARESWCADARWSFRARPVTGATAPSPRVWRTQAAYTSLTLASRGRAAGRE